MFGLMCIKLKMQTQTGHEQIRAGIRTGYVQIFTGIQNDTFRYCVRIEVRADTNRDTCRYELGYVQIRTVSVQIRQKYVSEYVY